MPLRYTQFAAASLVALMATSVLDAASSPVLAADDPPQPSAVNAPQFSNEKLLRRMEAMEKHMRALESELQRRDGAVRTAGRASPRTTGVAARNVPAPERLAATSGTAVLPEGGPAATPAQFTPPANQSAAPSPQVNTGNKDLFGLLPSPVEGLKLGTYGELKFGTRQNPAANGQWQNGFDAARLVLLPTYQFTDNIIFNAEIEFEHAGSGFDADDKLHGTAEVEQAYVDFRINPRINIRSPGIDLVPIGYTNLFHEPTLFYSVNRPEIANSIVPTTLAVPAASIYGKIVDNLNYQFQVSSSLEDFGGDFDQRTDSNRVPPFPTGYAAGINGLDALGFSKPPRGDFRQLSNDLAYTLRLSYTPPFIPGLAGSTSVYYTPNTTPRGAYADTGAKLGRSSLVLVDSELRYRVPRTGLEFRAEYAQAFFGNPANLRANNDSDPTNNAGSSMFGLSGEVAYHQPVGPILGREWDVVPFYRYTYENLQSSKLTRGIDPTQITGGGQVQFHTVGVAAFPTPQLVLKLNYQKVLNHLPGGAQADSVLGAVGFFF